jgi:hypothetical protein
MIQVVTSLINAMIRPRSVLALADQQTGAHAQGIPMTQLTEEQLQQVTGSGPHGSWGDEPVGG